MVKTVLTVKFECFLKISFYRPAMQAPAEEEINAEDFFSQYQIDRSIGASHYSRVYLATHTSTGRQVCLKVILKQGDDCFTIDKAVDVVQEISSPHLVQILNSFEDENMIVIVMEHIPGGDLFDWISRKGTISEAAIAVIVKHILVGLKVLHENGIIHRDLKPENILVSDSEIGNQRIIKLTDHCIANTIDMNAHLSALCETEIFSAPEILKNEDYSISTDMWSLGVLVFILLSGRRPFEEDEREQIFKKVTSGEYSMETGEWEIVTDEGRDFVTRLLQVNPGDRMTVDDAFRHPWLNVELPDLAIDATLKHLQLTAMGRKFKKMAGAAKSAIGFRQFTRLTQRPE